LSIPDGISGALKPLVLVIDAWPGVGDGPVQIEAGRAPPRAAGSGRGRGGGAIPWAVVGHRAFDSILPGAIGAVN